MTAIRPFHVDIPQSEVEDLRRRIAETRWPPQGPGPAWERGIPSGYLRELATYWRTIYDWRAAEEHLNSFPQYLTEIDGVDVHFLHVRSPEPEARPLLLTHGWPGSPVEFLDIVAPLTDPTAHGGEPSDAFHVVIPSIPGYGFSGVPMETGWDTERVAHAWSELMRRLGYERYAAQGGDWGSVISLRLGLVAPEHVAGVHVNMLVTPPPPDAEEPKGIDAERLRFAADFEEDGAGWRHIQSTRPQTLAYALTDSPVGQLAWIWEKFWEWTDSDQVPEDAVNRDRVLTNASVYWFTATAGPSAQLYYESNHRTERFVHTWAGPWLLEAPVGVAVFPKDAVRGIRRYAERILPSLTHWSEFSKGGHFAALERPGDLVSDVRTFCRTLEWKVY